MLVERRSAVITTRRKASWLMTAEKKGEKGVG